MREKFECSTSHGNGDPWIVRFTTAILLFSLSLTSVGCHPAPPPRKSNASIVQLAIASGLCPPITDEILKANVTPPAGWKPDPLKTSKTHRHRVWLSPTGDTAYGVIYFDLPLPAGTDLALWGFLKEMKKTEGEANLLSKSDDESIPGIRFVAEGGLYKIRCKMQVDGFHGWIVYAGSLRSRPLNAAEIRVAELAREQTQMDLP